MNRIVLFLFLVSWAGAGEFLGIVPNARPEDLSSQFTVIGQTARGVLVLPRDEQRSMFDSRDGKFLGEIGTLPVFAPKTGGVPVSEYYRVRLLHGASEADLAKVAAILDFDGQEYIVRLGSDQLAAVQALPAELSRISFRPMVLKSGSPSFPRVCSNPTVQAMVDAVSPDSVLAVVRRLQNYRSRYSTGDSCRAAVQWVAAKFRAYGCDSVYTQQHTSGHAPNVIGIKYGMAGQRNPYAVIDGHIDSYAATNAPGADDNASGTTAAIEACRVLRNYEFQHDMRFIAFTGEEFGLYGSTYYAANARSAGDSILGVFNFDMIGYVDVAPEDLDMLTKINDPPCEPFSDFFIACADTYTTLLTNKQLVSDNQNSDQGPFWNNGYLAFCGIEDFWPTNPHYHTPHDSIGAGYNDNGWCTEVIKAGVAALATICEPVPMNVPMVGYAHNRIDDATGNNNGKWDAGESIGVYVTLKNYGMAAAHAVNASIATGDPYVTLYRTAAGYGDIAGQDTAVSLLAYTMKAAPNTPREHSVSFDLTIVATETTWHNAFAIQVGEYLITDPVPDGPRTPALYWAYDDVDAGYPEHPTYNWVEIRGQGTQIPYPQNDDVVLVSLPSGFGPLSFYGARYTQVSVSADGWVCPGNYTTPNYSNTGLPNANTPPGMICLNWDDLYPDYNGQGHVYYYHDAANHRFVIEFDSVAYYSPSSVRDKFELIIYDTTVVTPSGDNALVVQYMTANGYSSSTVGIEDPGRVIAIQDYYNGLLAHGAAPIVPGRAIKYTTTTPTGSFESPRPAELVSPGNLSVTPNPVQGLARIRFRTQQPGPAVLAIYDAGGRIKEQLMNTSLKPGAHEFNWAPGKLLPGGVYFAHLVLPERVITTKVVIAQP
jgi:hypothetical protein